MDKKPERILIRSTNWIGDAVLTLPAIRSIRRAFPEAHISLLVKPWVLDIFKESPDIDEIIPYDDHYKGLMGHIRLARLLRSRNFNTAVLFQNAFDAALVSWLSGIPERIGYDRDYRALLLTKAVSVNRDIHNKHHVYYYQRLLESAGIETIETQPFIYLSDNERDWARHKISTSLTPGNHPIVGINPGATFGSAKRWLPERFAEVIRKIITELNGNVIIFGGPSEAGIADEIVELVRKQNTNTPLIPPLTRGNKDVSCILNMAGRTSLRQLVSLISECEAFVTNDSGPMHIASALMVPVVAIFGSTDVKATGPFGEGHKVISKDLPCSPCLKRECPEKNLNCMKDITADEVFAALKEIVPKSKAVLLDRDGTVIEDKNYLNNFKDLVIYRDSRESLSRLKEYGFKLIGITNQSGIARGIIKESFVTELHTFLEKELGIDDFFYCPHHPDERCYCRKPEPMMALRARMKHRIDFRSSYMIGDKELDVLLAKKIGAKGILLSKTPLLENTCASYIAKDLTDAVDWILEREKAKSNTAY